VLLAAREIHERRGVLGDAHDAQVRVDTGDEPAGGLGLACQVDLLDAGKGREGKRYGLPVVPRGKDIHVLDHLFAPADAPADLDEAAGHQCLEPVADGNRIGIDVPEEMFPLVLLDELDAFEYLFLGLLAETGKVHETVLAAGVFQLPHIRYVELFEKGLYLLRPQVRHRGELEERPGDLFLQLLVIVDLSCRKVFGHLRGDRLADPLDLP